MARIDAVGTELVAERFALAFAVEVRSLVALAFAVGSSVLGAMADSLGAGETLSGVAIAVAVTGGALVFTGAVDRCSTSLT